MTYIYYALKDGPIGLWSFDSIPLNDASGYGNNATYTGTPNTTRPIVAGGVSAQLIDSGDTINYPINSVMIQGRETRAFSLEAWIKPQSGTAAVMARNNSGLFLDGLVLRFSAEFSSLVSVTFNHLKAGNVYHVVGVYDGQSLSLYINGKVVASTEIDDDVVASGFTDTASVLKTTMGASMVVDTPAVYNYAIDSVAVNRHYLYGIQYPGVVNLSLINGGKYYIFSDEWSHVYDSVSFGDTDDWNLGLYSGNVSSVDNRLVNLYDETAEHWLGGTWTYQYSVASDEGVGLTLNGSRITWDTTDAITVEVSEDDTTWTTVNNGGQIVATQSLSAGYAIAVRITVPDTTVAQAVISNLKIVFYTDKTVKGSDEALPTTFVDALAVTLSENSYAPASFNDNAGVILPANNGFTIAADTDFGGYFAVEMTVKFDTSTINKTVMVVDTPSANPTITSNGSGQWVFSNLTALYIDGVAVTSPFSIDAGRWHHVLAVFPESLAQVVVGNNVAHSAGYPMRVGYLALYSDTITATMADAIFDTWVGTAAIRVVDEDTSNIHEHSFTETTSPFRAYAFDWSITGAG